MSRPQTSAEFLDLLAESRLIDDVVLNHLRPQVLDPSSKSSKKPEYAARVLYENKLVTGYQARQLMAGRYRGFYLAKYKFLELLGVGGMGKVYLAEQITGPRLVVIKVVRTNFKSAFQKEETFARFRREAEAVARLKHPNIIKAIDYDHENGIPYFVMEYVEGIDLGQQVDKFGALPWAHAADNMLQAAFALQHAHESEMVHRDVKPQNLLVSTTGEVKLLDLGLVSPFEGTNDDSLTTAENQIGSVDYIAPEQAVDSRFVDPRADVYGLGATFYAIIAGQLLFPDKTTAQKLLLTQTTMPTPIGELVPDLPKELAAIITKMLAKSPNDRFATMTEVAEALKPFAEPRIPPYEIGAVKFPKAELKAFLGRSPDAATLSRVRMGQAQPSSTSTDPKQAEEASSTITTSSPEPEFEDFFVGEHSAIGRLGLPPISHPKVTGSSSRHSRSREGRKKKRSNTGDLQRAAAVMAGVGVFLMVPLLGIYWAITERIDDTVESSPNPTLITANDFADQQPDDAIPTLEQTEETLTETTSSPEPEPASASEAELTTTDEHATDTSSAESTEQSEPTPETNRESAPQTQVVAKADLDNPPPPETSSASPNGPTWESVQGFYKMLREDPEMVYFASFIQNPAEKDTGKVKTGYFPNQATNPLYADVGLYLGSETAWLDTEGRWKSRKGAIAFRGKPFSDVAAIPEQSLQDVEFKQGFTIGLWIRIANTSLSQVLVSRGLDHWRLIQNKLGDITWSVNRPGSNRYVQVQSDRALIDEDWHYLVGVYQPIESDASLCRIQLFIDGVESGSAEGEQIRTNAAAAIALGSSHDRYVRKPLRGVIDDFMLINRPLTEGEVQTYYQQSRHPEIDALSPDQKSEDAPVPE